MRKTFNIKDIEVEDDKAVSEEELLTGDVLKGLSSRSTIEPNTEVEKDEYIQFPDGTTQKAVGKSHERGGIKVNIPDGTDVLSDHLKLTSPQARRLEKEFGINVSTKNTYAEAVEKYTAKVGLKKLNLEQEDVFKSLKSEMQRENIDSRTAKINLEYLSKKINDIENRKKPLEKERQGFFDIVFEMQESTKPKNDNEDGMKNGGTHNPQLKMVCDKFGISIEEGKKLLHMAKGGTAEEGEDPTSGIFIEKEKGLPTGADLTDAQKETLLKYYEKHNPKTAEGLKTGKFKWNNIVLNKGLVEDLDEKGYEGIITGKQGRDRSSNLLKSSPTYGGMTQRRVDNFVLKDYYENNAELNPEGKKFEDITEAEIGRLQDIYNADLKSSGFAPEYFSGVNDKEVSDKKFGNRTSSYLRGMVEVPGLKSGRIDVDRMLKIPREEAEKELEDYGVKYEDLAKYKTAAYKYIDIVPKDAEADVTPEEKPGDTNTIVDGTEIIDKVKVGQQFPRGPRMFYTPDQSVLPPSPMEAHLKGDIRLERIDPVKIGIENNIQETAKQRNFIASQLQGLPEAQRASVLANLLASGNEAVNQAATNANMVNAQNQSQAELFNIGQSGQEQVYGLNNALNFEQRQLTARAKTEEELRNYYDFNRKVNLNNFQNNQKMNLLGSLYPDYSLDFFGSSINFDPQSPWAVQDRSQMQDMFKYLQPDTTE
jgi:hypothetical protein